MTGSGKSGDCKRSERLKAALRENLRRRKAQAKARAEAAERHSAALDDSSDHPGGGEDPGRSDTKAGP